MSAGMLSLCLLAALCVILLIGWKGLSYFWPAPVYQFEIETPTGNEQYFGQIYQRESIPTAQLKAAGVALKSPDLSHQTRLLIKIANRENEAHDFLSVMSQNIVRQTAPADLAVVERWKNGVLFGMPAGIVERGDVRLGDFSPAFYRGMVEGILANQGESQRLREILVNTQNAFGQVEGQTPLKDVTAQMQKLQTLQLALLTDQLLLKNRLGELQAINGADLQEMWFPNQMNVAEKLVHWFEQLRRFVTEDPKEANAEGGVFPAIFGTVLMVLLMSIIVMPLGVLCAIYLHEYAKKNPLTRVIRIAVVNLAGVPSIVYGVFGLGFFVYFVGGNIDALFYADTLPRPTFGTPGLLWSSLTLAILTLPVVIVSTEEGLARIPVSVRHASLALGATQAETLRKIVLPMVSPAMMTGLILAVARAAGEVAPLMLVGVVKVAPSLPLDATFPYLHLDRKFMHLGYHIYDAGFQSPNSEAARPLVYATSFLLVTVIVSLNLTAILIRNHLREKYRALDADV